jgi:hypothetical protein
MSDKTKVWLLIIVVTALAIGVTWQIVRHRDLPGQEPAAVASGPNRSGSERQASPPPPTDGLSQSAKVLPLPAGKTKRYVVLSFQSSTPIAAEGQSSENLMGARIIPTSLSSRATSSGQRFADIFAANLRKTGAAKVIRKNVVFSEAELKDVKQTRSLRQELHVDVVVGGKLSDEYLTVMSVRADDAKVLENNRTKLEETPVEDVRAYVVTVKGLAYVREAGSTEEVRIRLFQQLHKGDRVRCAPDGEIAIEINNEMFKVNSEDAWFTVRAPLQTSQFESTIRAVAGALFKHSEERYITAVSR